MAGSDDDVSEKPNNNAWVLRGVSLVVTLVAVGVFHGFPQLPGFGGSAAEDDDEAALPPSDAMFAIRIRREPEEAHAFACLPSSWPDWHAGTEMVSGQIDTVAEAGDRVREFIGGGLGLGAPREVQWTMHTMKQPKYSIDGDGALHAVGHDVNDPSWRLDMR